MITELQKYRAQAFQVAGFAIMAPFGKMIMKIFDLNYTLFFSLPFYIALGASLGFLWLGIIFIFKGEEHLR